MISRWRFDRPKNVGTWVWTSIADPGAFVMERKMLRTIRTLAEEQRSASNDATIQGAIR